MHMHMRARMGKHAAHAHARMGKHAAHAHAYVYTGTCKRIALSSVYS